MKIVSSLLIVVLAAVSVAAQDFSNKGKDFWIGYGNHVSMYTNNGSIVASGGTQNLVLYFTSDVAANVKVEIPATGWARTYAVAANTVVETEIIPKTGADDARLATEGLSNKGIHVTSDKPIVAYAHNYDGAVSGASLLFPTNTLGQDYYVLGITQTSNSNNSYPFCFVIATEDNTVVEITPSANTITHAAGITFTQTLQKGQIYNLLGQLTGGGGSNFTGVDLTGTRIRSISSGANGCKKIAVFCGSGKINIKCATTGNASADNTIQQCFPSNAWGKKYITVPTWNMLRNSFRVMVNNTSTTVKLNGTVLTNLVSNKFYEFQSSIPNVIEADQPVMVAQFITTANQCGNTILGNAGDPEMIYLSPVEQTIKKITLNSTFHAAINPDQHYINIVMKTSGVGSFRIDGMNISGGFIPLAANPSYSHISYKTSAGIHNLVADSGFNAIAYGYGPFESYGYNAGTNVIDLFQFMSLKNQFATVDFPATCKNTPFFYSITLPYSPTSLTWDFSSNPNLSPNTNVVDNAPLPDSTFIRDGRLLYVYRLKTPYSFSAIGTYPVKVIANNPTPDGCSGVQEINFDVEVFDPPAADFSIVSTGCLPDAVKLNENTSGNSRPTVNWFWDFGDNTTDTTRNPVKLFGAAGNYNIKLRSVTDIGCLAEVTKPLAINPAPVAKFGMAGLPCINTAVTFSDTSTVSEGAISKWYWRFGNGDSITVTNNASQNITYKAPGTYNVTQQVETAAGCKSNIASKSVSIYATPVANFIMPQVCLSDAVANFKDSSFMSDGSTGLSYQWNFADPNATSANPNTSVQQNPAHTYSATGFYNVGLTVTSANGCFATAVKQFVVNGSVPKAGFNVLANGSLCSNLPVEIQNTSGVDFGSITRVQIIWDGVGAPSTSFTDSMPSPGKIYSHSYPSLQTTQTYQVRLEAYSGISCVDEIVKSIIVNASPKTSFTIMPGICFESGPRQVTQAAGGGVAGTEIFTGSGISPSGLFTPSVAGAGTHNIHYVYTSDKGCKDSIDKTITVWPSPTAVWGYSSPACINSTMTFSDSSQPNFSTINQWNWDFGDGTKTVYTNGNSFQKTYSAARSFTAALQVTTDSGCVSLVSSKSIVVHPLPGVDFSMPSVCLPDGQGMFTDLSTIPDGSQASFSYLWRFGDPNDVTTSSQKNPTHKYTSTGPFNVQLIITSGAGCIDSITKLFTTIYPEPKADFSVSPNDTCLGGTFYFNDLSNGVTGNITNWNWSFGDGTKSTLQNPVRKYNTARTFSATLAIVNVQGCISDTSKPVVVHPYPSVSAGQDLFVLEGGTAVLNATASGSNLNYHWTPATYLNKDSILKPATTPIDDVTYKLTVTSLGGCTGYDDVFVKVLKLPAIPNVFSPNGDGVNDTWIIKYLDTYIGNTVQVFNRYGQQVFLSNGYTKPWNGAFNGSALPEGVYYYVIDPKNGRKVYKGSVTILR